MPLKDSDYLQHSKKMLTKQPYIPFNSLAFAILPNLRHQPNPLHDSRIFDMVAKSVARQPNLRPGSQICGLAAKSVVRRQIIWTAAKSMAWRPILWFGSPICGMAAKSEALWQNLWHSVRICGTALKSPNL